MPKKKDILLIAVVVVLAAVLLGVSQILPKTELEKRKADVTLPPDVIEYLDTTPGPEVTQQPEATEEPEATEQPVATQAPVATEQPAQGPAPQGPVGPMPPAQEQAIRGYVIINVAGRQYGDPIPMDRDKIITIKQTSGEINRVHITPDMVCMESSTCDNQDCVGEGEITPENYKTRILSKWIYCLPNQVSIEFVPVEE